MSNANERYTLVEVKAGIFLTFCFALFVCMVLVYGKVSRFWQARQDIYVIFGTVTTLSTDSLVRFNGVEIGNVKSMRILHLDPITLERLQPLQKSHLDFLPLSDEQRSALRLTPFHEFDARCREALVDKTVIELTLEVLQEGQYRRFRVDDAVRINTNIMGDSEIEIVSGSGPPMDFEHPVLLVGATGDFFSNLARSMQKVKEVLGSVTDVLGAEERATLKRSMMRVDQTLDRVEVIAEQAQKRSKITLASLQEIGGKAGTTVEKVGAFFQRVQPDMQRLLEGIQTARTQIGQRVEQVQKEALTATKEVQALKDPIFKDAAWVTEQIEPHTDQLKENLINAGKSFGGVMHRIRSMTDVSGRVMDQSVPDLLRMSESLSASVINLKLTRYIALENKDKMIAKGDIGEHNLNTAIEGYRTLLSIARRPSDLLHSLEQARELVPAPPRSGQPLFRSDIDEIMAKITEYQSLFSEGVQVASEALLPPFTGKTEHLGQPLFERKRAGNAPQDPRK